MNDPVAAGGIQTNVPMRENFQQASLGTAPAIAPVMSFRIKPEAVKDIINNLDDIQSRTDDSQIVQQGSKYALMDNRTSQPLAELNTANSTLTMYKTPESMAARIDSVFVSSKDIKDFIQENKVEPAPQVRLANTGPS